MASKTRKYATATHPTIEALVHALYRYPTQQKAQERFDSISKHFVLAKEQPASTADAPVTVLWIKGFALTEAEIAEGYTGHYAEMRIARTDKGLFTLTATRLDKPLANHPQKKRPMARHPNWGHPVMRAVKKQKHYATLEEAQAELELLHTEFPDVSIPGQAKLFIIIYEKREGIVRPTHKIVMELKAHPEGGYTIGWRDNQKNARPNPPPDATEKSAADQKGYFTSLVTLNKKKRRKGGRPVTGKKPDEEV